MSSSPTDASERGTRNADRGAKNETPYGPFCAPRSALCSAEVLGWVVLAALLVVAVPLFLCMPLWADVTLYDVAARTVLEGGVHYRDVFDTNLPGMVWLQAGVRSLLGWSSEAMRAADLAVVGLVALVLSAWLGRLGVSRAGRLWFAIAFLTFYLSASEFVHCQRDTWMLVPALAALLLRRRQLRRSAEGATPRRLFAGSVPEGFCWGAAFWIKPHVGLVALAVWAVTLARVGGSAPGAGRRAAADALGLLAGGLLAGAPGVAWMVASGAWPHFLDVATNWNPHYYSGFWETLPIRVGEVGMYFPPWSACHLLALPVAVAMLVRARVWSRQPDPADETGRTGKALLAAFYLGWVGQAALLQKGMDYVHAPTVPLALAVLTAQRWPVAAVLFLWCFVSSAVVALVPSQPALHAALDRMPRIVKSWHRMLFFRHPLTDPERLKLWPRCLREGSTPELRDRLGFLNLIFCGTEWRDLYRVADFLRTRNLRDGELACWDDGTHPLYLILNVRPAIRYMHIGTVLSFRAKLEDIRRDVATSPQRYVVSDLTRVRLYHPPFSDADDPADPPGLPPDFPDAARNVFPWNQPVIFRAGRYRVHRVVNPVRAVITPAELRLPPGTLPTE